jgi:hypothetical protein
MRAPIPPESSLFPLPSLLLKTAASLSYTDVSYLSPGTGHDHGAPLPLVLSLLPPTPVSFLSLGIASFTLYSCVLFVTASRSHSELHHFQYHHYYHLSFPSPTANLPPILLPTPDLQRPEFSASSVVQQPKFQFVKLPTPI